MEILVAVVELIAMLFLMFCCVVGVFLFEGFALDNRHLYWQYPRWKANALLGLGFVVHTVRESLTLLGCGLRNLTGRW